MVGRILAHYRIQEKIGSGGMGEVYRALDTKLDRMVALKVLPPEAASPERLQRFEREAKAIAALNHPNIVHVHSVEEQDGVHFITMELVRGRSLRDLIPRSGFSTKRLLEIAVALADALAAAHKAGIVHRDLKPDNVMIDEEGRVKVLDFGLAKLAPRVDSEAITRSAAGLQTKEGQVVGTAPYLSPEQARGDAIDERSDVFSFGSVLYEMATGQRAFTGDSPALVAAAVVNEKPPPVSSIVPSTPLTLERAIARALRKEPDRRFQTMADVRVELLEIQEELASGNSIAADAVKPAPPRYNRVWLGVSLVVLIVAALYFQSRRPALAPPRTTPLTTYPGEERDPEISPDGTRVAFVMSVPPGETRDLYVKMTDGAEPLRVSDGHAITPTWSPDGRRIAFIRRVVENGAVRHRVIVVNALGGGERQLATSQARDSTGLSWSPDGKYLAMVDRRSADEPDSIFLLSLETGEKEKLTSIPRNFAADLRPRFSPQGRLLAFVRERSLVQRDIFVMSMENRQPRRLTFNNANIRGLDWTSDGEGIVFSAALPGRAAFYSLWRVPVSGGEPEPLTVGEEGTYPSLSRTGDRLVYAAMDRTHDIWRIPGPASSETEVSQRPFISSTGFDNEPRYSPDGKKIAFNSTRSGNFEIWICDDDGTNPRQLTFLEHPTTVHPSWSPDGREIAFLSPKEGTYDIYVTSTAGGFPRRLTAETEDEVAPNWSRDGRWIYFSSNRSGRYEIYKIPAKGGEFIQVTTNGGTMAAESPDGRFLYFTKSRPGIDAPHGIWRTPIEGGEEVSVHDGGEYRQWAVEREGVYVLNRLRDPAVVELVDVETREVSEVTVLDREPSVWGFSISPDRKWILYATERSEFDIMLVENFR